VEVVAPLVLSLVEVAVVVVEVQINLALVVEVVALVCHHVSSLVCHNPACQSLPSFYILCLEP
jgi:hypothetical protein